MSVTPQFRFEILDPAIHRREKFSCESPELTDFLRTRARKEAKSRTSACFVLVPVTDPGEIVGYYTLSATSVELEKLPVELTKKLPRYPRLPATLLGRLATDLSARGVGLGRFLLVDAMVRAVRSEIASFAFIVDAKDEAAAGFYERESFIRMPDQASRLMRRMDDIAAVLGEH